MSDFIDIAPMSNNLLEHLESRTEEQQADLILDAGTEIRLQIDLYALKQDPSYRTPMERYLDVKYAYHPIYIPLYATDMAQVERNHERELRRGEQRRIDAMDPWDYQLELDCAFLTEFDKQLSIKDLG